MIDSIIQAIKDAADWVADQFQYILGYLLGILKAAGERLLQALKWLLENILTPLWDFIETSIDSLALSDLVTSYNSLPGGIGYFLEIFQVPLLMSTSLLALGIRFLIRRLPVIG